MSPPVRRLEGLLFAAACAVLAGLAPDRARAADDPVMAALAAGHEALARGDEQAAYQAYRKAFARQIRYDTAANLGLLEAALGKRAEAATHLALALARFPAAGDAAIRGQLAAELGRLTESLGQIHVDTAARGAEILLDGRTVALTPLSGPLFVEPGEHELGLRAGDAHASSKTRAEAGQEQRVFIDLGEQAGGESALRESYVAVVAVGATLSTAAVSVGSALLFDAGRLDATANEKIGALVQVAGTEDCSGHGALCDEIVAAESRRDQHTVGGIIALAAGGALATSTIVYALVADASPATTASATAIVAPWIASAGSGGLLLGGRF
jgi:tetratricopeptide (TPR) repeat protein